MAAIMFMLVFNISMFKHISINTIILFSQAVPFFSLVFQFFRILEFLNPSLVP